MVDFKNEIVRNMKQRVRTPEFLNRVIKVYDFTTLFSRLMMYRRAKSSLVQPKKEGEEETMYNMYNSMFIRIKKKNKFNDTPQDRDTVIEYSSFPGGWIGRIPGFDCHYSR